MYSDLSPRTQEKQRLMNAPHVSGSSTSNGSSDDGPSKPHFYGGQSKLFVVFEDDSSDVPDVPFIMHTDINNIDATDEQVNNVPTRSEEKSKKEGQSKTKTVQQKISPREHHRLVKIVSPENSPIQPHLFDQGNEKEVPTGFLGANFFPDLDSRRGDGIKRHSPRSDDNAEKIGLTASQGQKRLESDLTRGAFKERNSLLNVRDPYQDTESDSDVELVSGPQNAIIIHEPLKRSQSNVATDNSFFAHRDDESDLRRHALNSGFTIARQSASVGGPTLVRKPIIIALKKAFSKLSPEAIRYISLGGVAYPLLLLGGGFVGDKLAERQMKIILKEFCQGIDNRPLSGVENDGELFEVPEIDPKKLEELIIRFKENNNLTEDDCRQILSMLPLPELDEQMQTKLDGLNDELKKYWWPTTSSDSCRLFFTVALLASTVAADQRGLLAKASVASTIWGVINYCEMRDVVQSFWELNEGVNKFFLSMTVLCGVAYLFLQTMNSTATDIYATPVENATNSEIWGKALVGASFNTLVEIVDILLLAASQSWRVGKKLVIDSRFDVPSPLKVVKTVTGTHASRTSLFLIDVLLVNFFVSFYNLDPNLGYFLTALVIALPEGGVLGSLYFLFLGLAARADWPDADAQTQGVVNR